MLNKTKAGNILFLILAIATLFVAVVQTENFENSRNSKDSLHFSLNGSNSGQKINILFNTTNVCQNTPCGGGW